MIVLQLPIQEIPVAFIDGTLPYPAAVSAPISFQNGFPLRLGVLDAFSQEFFLDFDVQAFVEHVDLALHGNLGVLKDIALHRFSVRQKYQVIRIDFFAYGGVINAVFAVSESLYELFGIQVDRLPQYTVPFQFVTILFQIFKPSESSLDTALISALAAFFDGELLLVPILVQEPDKKLFHGHLPYPVYVQVRKHPCDVI